VQQVEAFLEQIRDELVQRTYKPLPARRQEIPKEGGKVRVLSIPAIRDRVVQGALKLILEPIFEADFQPGSFGYRPKKTAHEAVDRVAQAIVYHKTRVIDFDLRSYFDNVRHDRLLAKVAKRVADDDVMHLLKIMLKANGHCGVPQGGVVSPLLANLFLHYAFDAWMQRAFPNIPFERFADDAIVHCRSEKQARFVLDAIRARLAECGLELHPTKTKIVYCKDDDRRGMYESIKFDFLGYSFHPRRAKNRWGKFFVNFLPAISAKAAKRIRQTIRDWRMASTRNNQRLEDLARFTNPVVRGWLNYYGRFYRSKCIQVLRHFNEALGQWVRWKFKRFKRRERASMHWLGRIARRDPKLFVLWEQGVRPQAGG
jgi:RNA-directed DNA polymerase